MGAPNGRLPFRVPASIVMQFMEVVCLQQQYFSSKPESASDPTVIKAAVRSQDLMLTADHGVFSRKGVDVGSVLLAQSAVVKPGATVLDLGCGYGVVGISIARSVQGTDVWMVDVNERAVKLSAQNATRNNVGDRTRVLLSDGTSALPDGLLFDVILFNPPIRAGKRVVFSLYEQACRRLETDGVLYVVIRVKQGANSSERFLLELFGSVETAARDRGYKVFACTMVRRTQNKN